MTSINSARMNKIGAGYSGSLCAHVSRGGVGRLAPEKFADRGALRVGGRVDGGFCDTAARALAATGVGILSTDFCGFQSVDRAGVCLVLSVWFRESRANAPFGKACLLIGNLTRNWPLGAAGGVASRFQTPARQGGATPFGPPALSLCPSRKPRWQFLKKDHLGPELPSISCTTLCWLEDFLVRVRKIYRGRMGSGVRAVRESVLNRRLARRPIGKSQILKARVGVQAMLSGRFGLNGIGKLCPVACHVN
jgi:hypothetical protein